MYKRSSNRIEITRKFFKMLVLKRPYSNSIRDVKASNYRIEHNYLRPSRVASSFISGEPKLRGGFLEDLNGIPEPPRHPDRTSSSLYRIDRTRSPSAANPRSRGDPGPRSRSSGLSKVHRVRRLGRGAVQNPGPRPGAHLCRRRGCKADWRL